MVVAGDIELERVKELSLKWFEPIENQIKIERKLPIEPKQTEARKLTVERDVPTSAIYKAYHMCARTDIEYHTIDLISDILSRGNSSRLYKNLIKDKKLFIDINAYVMGDFDKGLFVISGKLADGVKMEDAEKGIEEKLNEIKNNLVSEIELQKCKNKIESTVTFSEMDVLTKATNLAISELLGDANLINKEIENYARVTVNDLKTQANLILNESNCSTLYYLSNQKK